MNWFACWYPYFMAYFNPFITGILLHPHFISKFHQEPQLVTAQLEFTTYLHPHLRIRETSATSETKQRVEGRAELQNVFIHVEPRAMQAGIGRYQNLQTRSRHSWLMAYQAYQPTSPQRFFPESQRKNADLINEGHMKTIGIPLLSLNKAGDPLFLEVFFLIGEVGWSAVRSWCIEFPFKPPKLSSFVSGLHQLGRVDTGKGVEYIFFGMACTLKNLNTQICRDWGWDKPETCLDIQTRFL